MHTQGAKLAKALVSEIMDEFSQTILENSRIGHVIAGTAITGN